MDTYFVLATCITLVSGILIYVFNQKKRVCPNGTPLPGPTCVPEELSKDNMLTLLQKLSDLASEYGDIFKVEMFGKTMMYVSSVDALRKLFASPPYHDVTNDRPPVFLVTQFYKSIEGTVFNESGNDSIHKGLRRGLIRGLHVYGDGVKAFEETVKNEIVATMDIIDDYQGDKFEFMTLISRSLANIISVLLSGSPFPKPDDADLFTRYTHSIDRLTDPSTNGALVMFPWLRHFPGYYRRICQQHKQIMKEIMEVYFYKMKETYIHGNVRGLVDFYLSEQQCDTDKGNEVLYTDGRIITSILDLVTAGNSTSRAALGASILCLLEYPEYQTKLQNEIDDNIGVDRLPSVNDRQSCPLMEAFAMEVQRYNTVAPLSLVHTCGKPLEFEGFHIPEKTLIFPNVWHIHHNEEIWGDPWSFRPERFLDEHGQLLDKYHEQKKNWIPFGIGRRQCPAEMFARSRLFLYLSSFLQRWTFCPIEGQQSISCDPRKGHYRIGMSSEPEPFYCKVKRRV